MTKKEIKKTIVITSNLIDISDADFDEDVDYDDYDMGEEKEKKIMTKKQFLKNVQSLKKDDDVENLHFDWKEGEINYSYIKRV